MNEKHNDATRNRPDGERLIDAQSLVIDMPTYMADKNNKPVQSFMDAYNTADATVSKGIFKNRLNVTVGCKNLFDVTNIAANQTNAGAHSGGGTTAFVGTGRYYFVKLDINLHSNDAK